MFRRWCSQQGFCHGGSNLSHVLMDGGVLSVPFDRLRDFYTVYIEAIKNGETLFVVEQKTDTFNFFVDLDYKDTEELSFDRLEEVCLTICDRVSTFTDARVLISVAEPKVCGDLIKHGIHMNWPGFVVDHGSAMALHSHIVSALTILFPSKKWNDIVDTSVYGAGRKHAKGSGFRMPWSHKRAKHETCGGTGCDACEHGKVTQGQYVPVLVYGSGSGSGSGTLERIFDREPSVDIMCMATIRTEVTDHVIIQGSVREEGSFTVQETKHVFGDAETQSALETFIQRHMDGQGSATVTKVYAHEKIFLVSTNSQYCENIQRNHASNHVWFLIEGDTITQKCFCRCETNKGRLHGFCKDFSGRSHVLPDKVYRALYPTGYTKPVFRSSPTLVPASAPAPASPESPIDMLRTFICTHMGVGVNGATITSVKKGKTQCTIDTSVTCEACHKTNVPFVIKKKNTIIQQKCSCRTREHVLAEKIVRVL